MTDRTSLLKRIGAWFDRRAQIDDRGANVAETSDEDPRGDCEMCGDDDVAAKAAESVADDIDATPDEMEAGGDPSFEDLVDDPPGDTEPIECWGCGAAPLHIDDDQACVECGHVAEVADGYHIGDAAQRASGIVSKTRDTHGDAFDNHDQIAGMWSEFLRDKLDEPIVAWEASQMMVHVKQSRMESGALLDDHFVDVAGYGDLGLYCAIADPDVEVERRDV